MKQYEVTAVGKFKLKAHDPDETGDYKKTDQGKDKAKADTTKLIARLAGLQERLYANATRSLLIVLQGMDTSGKDGTIQIGRASCRERRKDRVHGGSVKKKKDSKEKVQPR